VRNTGYLHEETGFRFTGIIIPWIYEVDRYHPRNQELRINAGPHEKVELIFGTRTKLNYTIVAIFFSD
jgi:hypothetical protein